MSLLFASLLLSGLPAPQGSAKLLTQIDRGVARPIESRQDWRRQRQQILLGMQRAMGPLPPLAKAPDLDLRIGGEQQGDGYLRRTVTFASADCTRIPAYLYLPRDSSSGPGQRRPAVLALHPTSKLGKGVVDGQGALANRAYARELAQRGYVVLAPDYPSFGDYRHDFENDGYQSGTMKGIVDHRRGIDLLQSLAEVDPERIGVIGHSLGGHNAMFLAAFDARIDVVVSSCGWTPFRDYQGGDLQGWTSARYMPLLRDRFGLDPERVPFEFDQLVAALAPRAFFSSSPLRDDNFAVAGVRRTAAAAKAVFALRGVPDNLQVVHPDCGHDIPGPVRRRAYRFLDLALGHRRPRRVSTEVFLATPRAGVRTNARSYYTRAAGVEMMSVHSEQTRSDTADVAYQRFSADNGKSYAAAKTLRTHEKRPRGTLRRYLSSALAVSGEGQFLQMILQGVLPGDDPLAGMRHWTLRYALSRDGGRSFWHEAPVVHVGEEFSPAHPLPGLHTGKNSMMIGAVSCLAIRLASGEILQPVQITPAGPDGNYHNPGGGYTYHDAAVLIGRFNAKGSIDWRVSERVQADPARSTRGVIEPTIVAAAGERILMVLRGSNDRRPRLPGYRWFSVSKDRGRTWSKPAPWVYRSGKRFFSASSSSQLLRHSNGRIYWLGNIAPANPRGNHPRHPLLIGEVDEDSLRLVESSLCVIDCRIEGDLKHLQLSNFMAFEDRQTREIVVHCTPIGRQHRLSPKAGTRRGLDWTGDALVYRVAVPE